MAPIPGFHRALREVEHPSGPTAPVASIIPPCSGWSCLSDAEQFGVIFSVLMVVLMICLLAGWFALRPKDEDELGVELVHMPSTPYGLAYGISSPPQLPVITPSPMITLVPPPVQVYPQPPPLALPPPIVQPAHPISPMQPGPVYYQQGHHRIGRRSFSAPHYLPTPPPDSNICPRPQLFQGGVNIAMPPPAHILMGQSIRPQPMYLSRGMPQQQAPAQPFHPTHMPNPVYGYPNHQQEQQQRPTGFSWRQRLQRLFTMRTGRASTISDTSSSPSGITPSPLSTPAHSRASSPERQNSTKAKAPDGSTLPAQKQVGAASTRPATPFPKDLPPPVSHQYAHGSSSANDAKTSSDSDGDESSRSSSRNVQDKKRPVSRQSDRSWRSQMRSAMEQDSHSRNPSSALDPRPRTPEPKGSDWKKHTPIRLVNGGFIDKSDTDGTCTQISY